MTLTTSDPEVCGSRRRVRLRRPAHEPEPVQAGPFVGLPVLTRRPRPRPVTPTGTVRTSTTEPGTDTDALRRRATALVRMTVEILAGRRDPAHLARAARPEVVRYASASRTASGSRPDGVYRVHVDRPGPDAAEVVAVCRFGTRVRALALRLDRVPGATPERTWQITALRLL